MFMEIAIGAIGIGVVLMVGYLVIAQVRAALPSGSITHLEHNGTAWVSVDSGINAGMNSTQQIVFSGFALVAVGIIVLAAFGLISIFK